MATAAAATTTTPATTTATPKKEKVSVDDGGGFQRGFLLSKKTSKKKKNTTNDTKSTKAPTSTTNPKGGSNENQQKDTSVGGKTTSPSSSTTIRTNTTSNTTTDKDVVHTSKPSGGGWSKGFLNSSSKKKQSSSSTTTATTTATTGINEGSNTTTASTTAISKDLLEIEDTGRQQEPQPQRQKLVLIHDNERCKESKKQDEPTTRTTRPLISVLETTDDTDDIKDDGEDDDTFMESKYANTRATNKSSPLISIVSGSINNNNNNNNNMETNNQYDEDDGDDGDDGSTGGLLWKEVTTIRKVPDSLVVAVDDHTTPISQITTTSATITNTTNNDRTHEFQNGQEIIMEQSSSSVQPSMTHDDPTGRSIMEFQQELERIIWEKHRGGTDDDDDDDNNADDEDRDDVTCQNWTKSEARCAWIYFLPKLQQQQQLDRRPIHQTNNRSTVQSLCVSLMKRYPDIFESILQANESEEDRKRSLQAVVFLKHYGTQHNIIDEWSSSSSKIVCGVPFLSPVMNLSLRPRRTVLSQRAWETSILLIAQKLRPLCDGDKNDGGGSKKITTTTTTTTTTGSTEIVKSLLYDLQSLMEQQLSWQRAKKKWKLERIDQLEKLNSKIDELLATDGIVDKPDGLKEIVIDLESMLRE
jgi:hypothetical protein